MVEKELQDEILAILRTAADQGDMDCPVEWIRRFTDMTPPPTDIGGVSVKVGDARPSVPSQDVLMDVDVSISVYSHLDEDACGCMYEDLKRGVRGCFPSLATIRTENWHVCRQAPDWNVGMTQTDGTFRGMAFTATFHMITNEGDEENG